MVIVCNEICFVVSFPENLISSFHSTYFLKQLAIIRYAATKYLYPINYKKNADLQKQDHIASFNTLARNGRKQPNAVTRALSRRIMPT